MLDYKKMYHIMVKETENAINTLIAAQRKCEEKQIAGCRVNDAVKLAFLEAEDAELILMEPANKAKEEERETGAENTLHNVWESGRL